MGNYSIILNSKYNRGFFEFGMFQIPEIKGKKLKNQPPQF